MSFFGSTFLVAHCIWGGRICRILQQYVEERSWLRLKRQYYRLLRLSYNVKLWLFLLYVSKQPKNERCTHIGVPLQHCYTWLGRGEMSHAVPQLICPPLGSPSPSLPLRVPRRPSFLLLLQPYHTVPLPYYPRHHRPTGGSRET